MDTRLSSHDVQCRQFDPVVGPFSMNNEHKNDALSVYSVGSETNLVPIKSRDTYFKRRKKPIGLLTSFLALLVAILLLVVILLSVLLLTYVLDMKSKRNLDQCHTENCVRIAASLKESMDTSIDPCDDFYTWPLEHPTPESSVTNSWFSERSIRVSRTIRDLLKKNTTTKIPWAVEQAKILYESCNDVDSMNSLGLSPLFDLLEDLGLPRIPAAFSGGTGNFLVQMARVKKKLGRDIFFGLEIYLDPRNKSRNVIILDTPDTSSPLPSDKELDKRLQMVKQSMRKVEEVPEGAEEGLSSPEKIYMYEVMKDVISNGTSKSCSVNTMKNISDEELRQTVDNIYKLSEIVYYLVHSDDNETSSDEDLKDEDYMLVDDLQKMTDEYVQITNSTLTPRQIWRPYVEELFKGDSQLDLTSKDRVLIGNLDYLKKLAVLLAAADEVVLETVIWWVVVDTVVPHSSENLRKIWLTHLSLLIDVEITDSRSLHCARAVNQLMGMAVSWLFVDPDFHKEKGPKVREMVEDIRESFASLVISTDWMDRSTKIATLEKNKKMASVIGYPNWLFEEGEIDEYYEGIDFLKDAFLKNMLQIVNLRSQYELESLHDENFANETYWATDPTDVNAFHTFQANQITVPAGILQFPFYDLGLEALNYGAIGTVLGHELTHGFDNSGRQYDGDGNLRQWWSNMTIFEYTERAECFVEQYGSYYEKEVDDYVDGELTLGENIADNGGLTEAVLAYRRWVTKHGQESLLPGFTHLTHEQLLFLGFAHLWCETYTPASLKWMLLDSHCPGHVRLKEVLKNSHEFSKAWNCPKGSNMNPEKKCHLW
ncbi:neprilysin-1 isoform X2 [Cephus cinctus]|uniref:Neprilysin-1 isoform X2 n=1 Tax=Cephus cinctus TaxID=211228 RepID=A0AAJ7W6M0_CEPCN|nr:neprilysin-1 isoform X2 [Cephus cinctus]